MSRNPDTGLFVSSSGKPSPRPPSWQGWKTRRWITRLSGTMLRPSTAVRGAARFISSLPDIPASPSPGRAVGAAPRTRAISGRMWRASSARSGPNGASSRMSTDTCIWAPPRCSKSFRAWATALRRACSRRERLAHPNTGDASSLWPTPTTSLYANSVSLELSAEGLKLRDDPAQKGSQISIGKAARTFTLIWLLVRATGAEPTGRFRFPYSRPLHLNLATGPRYSPGDLSFNPNFSDWVMGWPIGWTEPGRPVTEFARWLRRARGAC